MSEGPIVASAYRVPRSRADETFVMAEPLPSINIGSAQVISVEGETATVLIGDETISGVVFLGDPPEVGDYVEIESRDDLTVIPDDPAAEPDTFIEGISTAAAHIVSEEDPGATPDVDVPVAGSMRDLDSWTFLPGDDLAWHRDLDATGAGLEVTHDGTSDAGPGTLWSLLPFDVLPGDVLHLAVTGSWLSLSTITILPVVAYGPVAAAEDPLPGDDTQVVPSPLGWLLDIPSESFTADLAVPEQITTVAEGDVAPARARLGFTISITTPAAGPDVDLLLAELSLVRSSMDWPIGSVWFDPDADTGGLITVPNAPQEGLTAVDLPATTTFARSPGFRKAVVAAPQDTGGILVAHMMGGLVTTSSSIPPVDFRLATDLPGDHNFPFTRYDLVSGVNIGVTVLGNVEVDPGDQGEVWVEYRYASDPGGTLAQVRLGYLLPIFYPAARRPGEVSDPMTRYWDGDSWRPPDLHAAEIDLSVEGTVVPGAKTATTTTASRTPSSCDPGDTITLTATVTPSGADGTVAFYRGPSVTGPWTKIGTAPMSAANVARKTYKPSSSAVVYFLAKYLGSGGYAVSSDPTSATTVGNPRRTVVDTFNALYVQAYGEAGNQITAAPNPDGVQQGYFGSVSGNRRSLIGFAAAGLLPTDAQVQKVELVCHNWAHWEQASNVGSIRLGWHSRATKPTTYGVGTGDVDKSTHSTPQGGWRVAITSWADTAVMRPDFHGIAVGPGASNGDLYQGYSAEGPGQWDLVVTYTTRS